MIITGKMGKGINAAVTVISEWGEVWTGESEGPGLFYPSYFAGIGPIRGSYLHYAHEVFLLHAFCLDREVHE